jgi:hypothetical protein
MILYFSQQQVNNLAFFSLWLFIWFLFFFFGIIKANPIYFLIFAYIYSIIGNFIIYFSPIYAYPNLIKFTIINIIIKIIPIILILIFYQPSFNYYDIIFGFSLLYIYFIVMLFLKINPIQYYIDIINKGFILNDKNYYPFIMFLFNN